MSRFNDSSDLEDLYTPSPKRFRENIENISMPSGSTTNVLINIFPLIFNLKKCIIQTGYGDLMNVSSFLQSPAHLSVLLEASKITEASDADNTLNCTDYLSKEIDEALKAKKLLDKNLVDEINEYKCLLKEVASARSRCKASEFVIQTMREEFENSTELPPDLKKKCSQHVRFSNFLRDFKNYKLLAAMGISDTLSPVSLTCDEKKVVNSAIRKALEKKNSVEECEKDAKRGKVFSKFIFLTFISLSRYSSVRKDHTTFKKNFRRGLYLSSGLGILLQNFQFIELAPFHLYVRV